GDLDRTGGGVRLVLHVLLGRDDELLDDVLLELAEALVVAVGEADGEDIGDEHVAPARGDGAVVHRLADGARELHRLDLGLEGAREQAVDAPPQPSFDPVEEPHVRAPPPLVLRRDPGVPCVPPVPRAHRPDEASGHQDNVVPRAGVPARAAICYPADGPVPGSPEGRAPDFSGRLCRVSGSSPVRAPCQSSVSRAPGQRSRWKLGSPGFLLLSSSTTATASPPQTTRMAMIIMMIAETLMTPPQL